MFHSHWEADEAVADTAAAQIDCRTSWLTGLNLMTVQPACLPLQPGTLAQQQTPLMQEVQVQQHADILPAPSHQHELLLQLEAILAPEQPSVHADPPTQEAATALYTQHCTAHTFPQQPLRDAQLELYTLNRQMVLLQHQQLDLVQLLQQQFQQRTTYGDLRLSRSAEHSAKGTLSVHVNVHTSIPCQPTDRLLDFVHLVILVSSKSWHQQKQQTAAMASPASSGVMVADVPLLVLPAAAQQEVQQLLLPAMRQEIQAEQQHTQDYTAQQHNEEQFLQSCHQAEHAAWQHYCQLAKDILTVVQLSAAAEGQHAAAGSSRQGTEALATVVSGSAGTTSILAVGNAPGTTAGAVTPAVALAQLAQTLLFPLLLPFLAAQEMHTTLQLLLSCLPQHLQQQWHQQQSGRLQELATAAPSVQLPIFADAQDLKQQRLADSTGAEVLQESTRKHVPKVETSLGMEQALMPKQQQQQHLSRGQDPEGVSSVAVSGHEAAKRTNSNGSTSTAAGAGAFGSSTAKATGGSAGSILQQRWCPAAIPGSDVAWYMPFTQFADGASEQSYLVWKHQSLLHLDYIAALFGLLYLAVVLRRLLREPTTLFYFAVILTKVLPHVPLMLGWRQTFLRHRETWLMMVGPTMALIALALSVTSIAHGQPALLLPNRAYQAYWRGRGELQTTVMRPFTQHMRLKPYIVYSLLDAGLSVWVFGQVFGLMAALKRWAFAMALSVGLSWSLDLYMRRRYVKAVLAQHSQLQERLHQKQHVE